MRKKKRSLKPIVARKQLARSPKQKPKPPGKRKKRKHRGRGRGRALGLATSVAHPRKRRKRRRLLRRPRLERSESFLPILFHSISVWSLEQILVRFPIIVVTHQFFCLLASTSTRDQQQIRSERFVLEQWTFCVLPTCINNKSSLPLRLLISETMLGSENKNQGYSATVLRLIMYMNK